jgi:hypothetical protein
VSQSAIIAGGVVLGTFLLFIVLSIILRKRRMNVFRPIPAFRILNQMMGRSVEQSQSLHLTLGSGSLIGSHSTIGFIGLSSLENLSRVSLISDRPAVCTTGDGGLDLISKDVLNQTYRQAIKLGISQRAQARFTGATPGAYVTGTLTALLDDSFSGTVLIGNFNNLAVLLTGLPFHDHTAFAVTDNLDTQAALFACSEESLLGEDAYVAGAYTAPNPSRSASLVTQDVLRWLVVVLSMVIIIFKLTGIL